jgi:altronate dehydratase large subunit
MIISFLGYPRPDGSVGIRNHVLVLPGGLISTKICEFVNGSHTIISADTGLLRTKRDREIVARTLVGIGKNPNVAGLILHDISAASGYPELKPETLAHRIAETGKSVEVITSNQYPNACKVIERGIRVARQMVCDASSMRRQLVDDSHLAIGVKCGRSDATSGIAGNPVMGYLVDNVVDAGGIALFGETTEIIGAEHLLAKRAISEQVGQEIIKAALETEEKAKSCGEDIRTINPMPANISGGISTLEEKSLGAIAKAGTSPIQGVLKYAQPPAGKGLYFVDSWPGSLSILLGFEAAGATLTLYQLGGGGFLGDTILFPSPSGVAPLFWTTANRNTFQLAGESIDFFSGTVIEGKETIEQCGEKLCRLVREVASGSMCKAETIKYQDPVEIYRLDHPF